MSQSLQVGRIPALGVGPLVDGGAFPTKSVVDEEFTVTATVFREGHDAVNATAVLTAPSGATTLVPMTCTNRGLDAWECVVSAPTPGMWTLRVEGWSDPYATWRHDAIIKIEAGVDVDLMLAEGALVLDRWAAAPGLSDAERSTLASGAATLRDENSPVADRLAGGTGAPVEAIHVAHPLREFVSGTTDYPWLVERELALTGAWYEIFPRSEGAHVDEDGHWVSGTLRTAAQRLDAIAAMGFDVVYLTPIHPIGEINRKGPNNTLNAGPLDPGSPYAIGSKDGGHDAIHPDLGTFDDFDAFVAHARDLGLEVALDLALQCAPDHPWVSEHPEWFTTRADGTIAYAENPPKKYQDIYPLNFDNDPEGIYRAVREVVQVWIDHGVTLFRVDNPHTKPLDFWQWLIADVAKEHPEIIWLAEAFTRPAMMHTLGKIGFQQSYTYFTWRNEPATMREYCQSLATESAHYMRPSFWPTTHDILTPYMQFAGPTGWTMRAAIAATLSPTYGIYTGYELIEDVPRPGAEEQIDNEKYQYKDRRWADYERGGSKEGQSLAQFLGLLNKIRHEHPALHWLRNLRFHHVDDETMLAYSKKRGDDVILVVATFDPHATRESTVRLDMAALGLEPGARFTAVDLLSGAEYDWGADNFVRLGPATTPVHIFQVKG